LGPKELLEGKNLLKILTENFPTTPFRNLGGEKFFIFPESNEKPLPKNFKKVSKKIFSKGINPPKGGVPLKGGNWRARIIINPPWGKNLPPKGGVYSH